MLNLVELLLQAVFPRKVGRVIEMFDHRIERAVHVKRRTLEAQSRMRLLRNALAQRLNDSTFTDARLPGEQYYLAFACIDQIPAAKKQLYLFVAADKRREPGLTVRGLEASLRTACSENFPAAHRIQDSFEHSFAKIFILECRGEQVVSARGDNYLVHPC